MTRPVIVFAAVLIALVLLPAVVAALMPGDTTTYQLGHGDHVPTFGPGWEPVDHVAVVDPADQTTTTAARKSRHRSDTYRASSAETYPTDQLLDRLAYCETGGTMNPATNTGNGFYGAFQFDLDTWWSVGGDGYPHEHPYSEQRDLARTLILQAGWGRFPTCSRTIGAR